ncbi:MAG: serine/threonine-protein kinase [Myxococcales bacterium]
MSTDPILPPEPCRHSVVPVTETDENFVPPFSVGQLLLDKYQIKSVIGTGGIGYVISAVNTGLDEPVALKFLRPEFVSNGEAVHRFMTEARLASKIQNPHVTRVLDVCTTPEHGPFIVMDLLVGRDLNQVLQEKGPLPTETAVNYLLEACEGLAAAHARDVLHRDVKPDNLFLARQPHGPDIIKILDFGISKLQLNHTGADAELSPFRTITALGSPSYMSPEQIRADPNIDARTDVWSLGCVLYELLAGEHAFNAPTLMQICAVVLERPAPSIRTHAPGVPAEIDLIIQRCLEKDPDLRYPSVTELAAALSPFASSAARGAVERCSVILGQPVPELPEVTRISQLAFPPPPLPTLLDEPEINEKPSPAGVHLADLPPFSTAPVALNASEGSSAPEWLSSVRQNWVAYAALATAVVALIGPNFRDNNPSTHGKPTLAAASDQRISTRAELKGDSLVQALPSERVEPKPSLAASNAVPAVNPQKSSNLGARTRLAAPGRAYRPATVSGSAHDNDVGISAEERLHVPSTLAKPGQGTPPDVSGQRMVRLSASANTATTPASSASANTATAPASSASANTATTPAASTSASTATAPASSASASTEILTSPDKVRSERAR